MEHHHHHNHVQEQSLNGIFILSIILNVVFVLVEAGVGLWQDSLSLLSDADRKTTSTCEVHFSTWQPTLWCQLAWLSAELLSLTPVGPSSTR